METCSPCGDDDWIESEALQQNIRQREFFTRKTNFALEATVLAECTLHTDAGAAKGCTTAESRNALIV
jgi:hypothetical protein